MGLIMFNKHTKHKIIWPEDLSKWAGADRVHGARLKVHQDGTRDIFVSCEIKQVWCKHPSPSSITFMNLKNSYKLI